MRGIDFSSWQSLLATTLGLVLVMLVGIGIRILMMVTLQRRRERLNRQINERLRTLIAAYKVLGGSFTGTLTVDPAHLRNLRQPGDPESELMAAESPAEAAEGSDRRRRIRDAVEAALSDVILLGTEDQVRLAERAARALVAGQTVPTHDLVVALRDFIRQALDLDPIPADLILPLQGPTRPSPAGGRGKGDKEGPGRGGGSGGMAGGMAMGAGMGLGGAAGGADEAADLPPDPGRKA